MFCFKCVEGSDRWRQMRKGRASAVPWRALRICACYSASEDPDLFADSAVGVGTLCKPAD